MKCIRCDLPETLEKVEIELFFDLHIGSPRCDYNLLKEKIKRVAENDNVYAIIGGDVVNNSTKASVGDVYEEPLSPMQQVKQATELFRPIADKILCVCSGNHEARSYKSDGIDLLYFMCAELGIAEKYDMTACLAFVRFGRQINHVKAKQKKSGRKLCYSIYVSHGTGQGGRTIGGKANGLERRGQIIDADIVITGHTHQPISFRNSMFRVDPQNSSYYQKDQLFVNTSAFLGYESYAETYGMRPTSSDCPIVILDGHTKQMVCTI